MRSYNIRVSIIVLILYLILLYFGAVLNRDSGISQTVKLELFWGYDQSEESIYIDKILNIAVFIPIGVLAGIVFKKYRVLKALLVGLLVSLTIELSQLTWKRGVFDIDDLSIIHLELL